MQDLEQSFDRYALGHRNPVNQAIHCVCVPLSMWSVIAALWAIPPIAPQWFQPGLWAIFAMLAAYGFYRRMSRPIGYAMAAAFIVAGAIAALLYAELGAQRLLALAIGLFTAGALGQAAGHALEGSPRSGLVDLTQCLIAPAWLMARLLRRFGIAY